MVDERTHYIPSGCAISGIMAEDGGRFSGREIIESIAAMHFRSNGLGGGFAGYGLFPDHAEDYCLQMMYDDPSGREAAEAYLHERFEVVASEEIPTRPVEVVKNRPILWRYFLRVLPTTRQRHYDLTEDDVVVDSVMEINRSIDGAFVASSGKNMGVFKGVGFPEDIGEFYRLDEYEAYTWTAHGRFPTNTSAWWGGAHPFGLLDWTVVHNGEISSYGINRRYLENFDYHCALHTDTEVICYLVDLLIRKHGLNFEQAALVLAAPFWDDIDRMDEEEQQTAHALRVVYGGALLNGPFSVVIGHRNGMVGLNDRVKLRPMVAARHESRVFIASEEAAIRVVCPAPDKVWAAEGGKPIVAALKTPAAAMG